MNKLMKTITVTILAATMVVPTFAAKGPSYKSEYSQKAYEAVKDGAIKAVKTGKTQKVPLVTASYPSVDEWKFDIDMALAEALASPKNNYIASMGYQYIKAEDVAMITFDPIESPLKNFFKRLKFENKVKDIIKKNDVKSLGSDAEKVRWVYDYVLENLSYSDSDDEDYNIKVNNAYYALFGGETRCYGYSTLIQAFLDELKIDNELIGGKVHSLSYDGTKKQNNYLMHGWNIVKIDGKWYHLDATFEDEEGGKNKDEYFLVTDSNMDKYRTWNKGSYEKTPTVAYNK